MVTLYKLQKQKSQDLDDDEYETFIREVMERRSEWSVTLYIIPFSWTLLSDFNEDCLNDYSNHYTIEIERIKPSFFIQRQMICSTYLLFFEDYEDAEECYRRLNECIA